MLFLLYWGILLFSGNSREKFLLVFVGGVNNELEANGYHNHQAGEEPVTGGVGAAGEVAIQVT